MRERTLFLLHEWDLKVFIFLLLFSSFLFSSLCLSIFICSNHTRHWRAAQRTKSSKGSETLRGQEQMSRCAIYLPLLISSIYTLSPSHIPITSVLASPSQGTITSLLVLLSPSRLCPSSCICEGLSLFNSHSSALPSSPSSSCAPTCRVE